MKFQSALSFLAVSGAALVSAEASILERQVQTIIGVVNSIDKATQALDTAIKGFSGDPSGFLAASQKVQDTVTQGVSTVNGASSITLTDSVSIQGQVQNLQTTVESVVNDLISKKDALVSAGQGGTIESSLVSQLSGAKSLQVAISSKVPPEVQSLAQQLSQGINTALQKGIDAFQGTGGSASGSGSSAGSSSSGASSSGASSSGSSGSAGSAGSSGSSGSSGSTGSSLSAGSGSSGSSGSGSGYSGGASVTTSSSPKPATYTGAAAPRAVAGSLAGAVAVGAVVFAL